MERLAELADLQSGTRSIKISPPEVRLAKSKVDEDPAGLEDAVVGAWHRSGHDNLDTRRFTYRKTSSTSQVQF